MGMYDDDQVLKDLQRALEQAQKDHEALRSQSDVASLLENDKLQKRLRSGLEHARSGNYEPGRNFLQQRHGFEPETSDEMGLRQELRQELVEDHNRVLRKWFPGRKHTVRIAGESFEISESKYRELQKNKLVDSAGNVGESGSSHTSYDVSDISSRKEALNRAFDRDMTRAEYELRWAALHGGTVDKEYQQTVKDELNEQLDSGMSRIEYEAKWSLATGESIPNKYRKQVEEFLESFGNEY